MQPAFVTKANEQVHPVAQFAIDCFFRNNKRSFSKGDLDELRRRIARVATTDRDELGWMTVSIARTAMHLELECGQVEAANALLAAMSVASRQLREVGLEVFEQQCAKRSERTTAAYLSLTQTKEKKAAPIHDAPPPNGTLVLRELRPRKVIR